MKVYLTGAAILFSTLFLSACGSGSVTTPIAKAPAERKQEVQCYQEFSALQKLDPVAYESYRKQFDNINKNYKIYESNKSLVDGNASEVMLTEINKKLSLVCVRIRNTVYTNMMNRANEMNKL
ncbi:hypothetical protein GNG26_17395 [Leclercia sp. J807]|uniref:hypothetical protein n=1 Tax=Leclercia TaxID=83654 RepID=UPI0011AF1340|nr:MULTISPECIES: hypothetical protein [Leclercia]MBW9398307.1 hypothetical protein [Leclercia sp. EC_58]MCG1032711.1 hypothetical protein [Bacillus amyloliquefaciens]QGU12017.1 hypothetical protein GNG26_17395 [Leclercia sp. J807]WNY85969.1 hypothetical protein NRF19_15530 [Leclercia adecarboxylata]